MRITQELLDTTLDNVVIEARKYFENSQERLLGKSRSDVKEYVKENSIHGKLATKAEIDAATDPKKNKPFKKDVNFMNK